MLNLRFVVNPPNDQVHLLIVDADNPMLDMTVCGESPGGLAMTWADLVRERADLYPAPLSIICRKCFPNLAPFITDEVLIPGLTV